MSVNDLCNDCGACCATQCSPLFVPGDGGVESLPADVRADYESGMRKRHQAGWVDDVPCFWLDLETRRCRQYAYRPKICREFEPGSVACQGWRARSLTTGSRSRQ